MLGRRVIGFWLESPESVLLTVGRVVCWRDGVVRLVAGIAGVGLLVGVIASGVIGERTEGVSAQEGTKATVIALTERGGEISDIDLGEPGPSVGDMQIWGPTTLYDEADEDSGATTQGTCIALNAEHACMVNETIVFADGSTIQLQGVERPDTPSMRVIVGGSGQYLGATGTMMVEPNEDGSEWQKTIEIVPK